MYSTLGGAGGKFSLEEGMRSYSSILAWRIPMDRGAWKATVHGVTVVKNPPVNAWDIRNMGLIPGSGRSLGGGHGNPLQYSCWEKSHEQRSLAGYGPWGHRVGHAWSNWAHTLSFQRLPLGCTRVVLDLDNENYHHQCALDMTPWEEHSITYVLF